MEKCLLLMMAWCIGLSLAASKDDVITFLPGLSKQPSFNQYSGYLSAVGNRSLHYWFVESQSKPSTDPLIVWTNGGPGCSSMLGILTENGPFTIQDDGVTLDYNDNSWNKFANVLYIESPAGVGYSYAPDGNVTTGDDQITEDHYAALLNFYETYSDFKVNELFLIGESFSGVYTPLLSAKILAEIDAGKLTGISFGGFVVGNGVTNDELSANSLMYFLYYHGLLGMKTWSTLVQSCCDGPEKCNFYNSADPDCAGNVTAAISFVQNSGVNMYNILADCAGGAPHGKNKGGVHGFEPMLEHMHDGTLIGRMRKELKKLSTPAPTTPPCLNLTSLTTYMNNPYTKTALHIATGLPDWTPCNPKVEVNYKRKYFDLSPVYISILKNLSHKLRILVFNGDVDTACNFLGNQWFVDALGAKDEVQWRPWLYNDGSEQVAGFVKEYDSIAFATVKGAGHMAPSDKPIATSLLIQNYVTGKPF